MNVALDGMPLASQLTGVGHYTFELARSMALAAPADRFTLVSPLPASPAALELISDRAPANLTYLNLSRGLVNRRWFSVGLPLYLRRHDFDLFHGTNYEIPLWSRQPAIVTIHDLSLLLHPEAHEPRLVQRGRWRLPLMARSAASIVTPTEAVKGEVCERLQVDAEKVFVTPEAPRSIFTRREPAATEETRQSLGVEDEFILFVGTLEPRKNLQRLVDAFELILRTTSLSPQLVIAGGQGWLMDDFAATLQQRNLDRRVRLTGYLNDDDLCALYSACQIFVYPSLYEGFGLPPLEAMACGAPVITSDIAPLRETVNGSARLIDPLDTEDLAKAIAELLSDGAARAYFSRAGVERAKGFTWDRTALRTLEVYRQVV